jgi:hypothetical protein
MMPPYPEKALLAGRHFYVRAARLQGSISMAWHRVRPVCCSAGPGRLPTIRESTIARTNTPADNLLLAQ